MRLRIRLGMLVAGIVLASLAVALVAASPKTETVTFPSGSDTVSGFLSTPEKAGRHPAIIVIHEWWGLNDWIKEQTVKLSDQGYVALAVDLYHGKTATDPGQAHELMRGLPQDRGVRDLQAAFTYLAGRPDVEKEHIASIGWCMGGGFSIQLAVHQPRLAACVVNYGALPTDPNDLQQIFAPILGNFGGQDKGITPADVDAFQKTMKNMSKRVDIKSYPDAGHAFENPNNAAGYRPEDAEDAWKRTLVFLNHALK
jgi:carboxymethylenebutenolidase